MTLRLRRVEAEKYTAFDGRYTILREPPELAEWGLPPLWLVYDEKYGGQDAGICMDRMERLGEVRRELSTYHADIVKLEAEQDDEALPDHARVSAAIKLRATMSREEVAELFGWSLDRAIAALQHPQSGATARGGRPFGGE